MCGGQEVLSSHMASFAICDFVLWKTKCGGENQFCGHNAHLMVMFPRAASFAVIFGFMPSK